MQNDFLPLPLRFEKNGFLYWQLVRTPAAAIYEQRTKDGRSIFFEVWRVRRRRARVVFGHETPATEVIPGNESWGKDGWTFYTLDRARAKYDDLNGWAAVLESFDDTDHDQANRPENGHVQGNQGQPGDQVPTVNLGTGK